MPDTTNSPTTGVQPATQPATGVQPVSGVQPGVPFQDLTKWATKAPEGETLISTAYRDKVTDDLKFVENKPGVHKPDPILVADNVTRKFGGMTAVDVSHFEIERHGITALIGPNGAGKTTFFNLMTGFDTPNTGTWQFDGKDMAHVQPEKVARMGMVRTFQLTKVMSRLTVLDNMLLGAPVQPGEGMFRALFPGMWRKQEQANIEKAEALLERFLLIKKKDDYAGALSGGQRKLLDEMELPLARVLADMERIGFAVDAEGIRQFGDSLRLVAGWLIWRFDDERLVRALDIESHRASS